MASLIDSDFEAVFNAAAHHLIACRSYGDAIEVLKVCHMLLCSEEVEEATLEDLAAARQLFARLFAGYPGRSLAESAELVQLRRLLKRIDRAWMRQLRHRGARIKTLYDFLRLVKRRPALYIGKASVERLWLFMGGLAMTPPEWQPESPPFSGFLAWLSERHPELPVGGRSWAMLIADLAGGDGPEALKLFFRELQAYRREAA